MLKLLRGDHISFRRCSVLGPVYVSNTADNSAGYFFYYYYFLLKVTEKSRNKTCINSQSWNWGCLLIYAFSFGFDLLKNVTCHIIYSSGILSLTTYYYTLTVNLIMKFHMIQVKENNLPAVSSAWFCTFLTRALIQNAIRWVRGHWLFLMGFGLSCECLFRAHHFRLFCACNCSF